MLSYELKDDPTDLELFGARQRAARPSRVVDEAH
jgi:hypothetical protein